MTVPVTASSTDGLMGVIMFDFTSAPSSPSLLRRESIRALYPLLTSRRLVCLFVRIGQLAVTKPASISTLETVVGLARPRQARAELAGPSQSARRSG